MKLSTIIATTALAVSTSACVPRPATPLHSEVQELTERIDGINTLVGAGYFLADPLDTARVMLSYQDMHGEAEPLLTKREQLRNGSGYAAEESALVSYDEKQTGAYGLAAMVAAGIIGHAVGSSRSRKTL